MRLDHLARDPLLAAIRWVRAVKRAVKLLATTAILFPPPAHRRAIVARRCGNCQIAVLLRIAKGAVLGPALNTKPKNTEFVKYLISFRRNSTQIFGAHHHFRCILQCAKASLAFLAPVLTLPIEVVPQSSEAIFGFLWPEVMVRAGVVHVTRQIKLLLRIMLGPHRNHVVNQRPQFVAENFILSSLVSIFDWKAADRKLLPNRSNGVELWFELVHVGARFNHEPIRNLTCAGSKSFFKHPPPDIWLCQPINVADANALQLLQLHWLTGLQMPEKSRPVVNRNAPYSEKAQHVIDAERLEILRHVTETLAPPRVIILRHHVPVVKREVPVLSRAHESRRPG
mmetsp:Transcript_12001/g.26188  ORF Transcript_12001/g.26188 Transcript_12001/m.26188 type:complete len:340 (+) Transcript_12001:1713-2732(+)